LTLLIQLNLFGQTRHYIKLSGHVYGHILDSTSKRSLDYSDITLFSSTGSMRETITNKFGFYSLDSINSDNESYEIKIENKHYFGEKSKLKKGILHDTTIDFLLTQIPILIDWFPELYFKYNSSILQDSSKVALSIMLNYLIDNPELKVIIIGHKDSLETNDMRYTRTEFVYDSLIKLGIDKNRLRIEISDKPNILKFRRYYVDASSGNHKFIELNEKYITNSPIERQSYLRQLNQCVDFNIER